MNSTSINFESFIEWDNSPFILFSNQGKILYLNHTAEILFGYVSQRELYDMAVSYAPQDFGNRLSVLSLTYDVLVFYAIHVSYENENEIALRLYPTPCIQTLPKLQSDRLTLTDINILLEANLSLFRSQNRSAFTLFTDQDLPPFKIDQNSFSKLLRKVLETFRDTESMDISLKLLIGQHVIIENTKRAMIQLTIHSSHREVQNDKEIAKLSLQNQIKCFHTEQFIKLEIPLLL
ncbi:MAG: PAS domain-containing protein [Sulfurovum sp.]|nr:PAS domain-containing protein [Sulfurovum sp.]